MRKTILVNLFVAALTVGTLTGCEMGADKNAPKFKEISIEYNRSNSSGLGQISYGNTSESEQFEKDIEEMVPPIKEECNTKYFLSPNEQYTVKVTFENPKEYPISSITYGGQVFVASSFVNEVSTDEVKFVATAPNMPGYKDLSISNFTYLKKEKINEVQLTDAEASINLGVKYVSGVTAELIDKIPSSSRATINLSFNDSDYISDYELTKFYLSDGSKIVYEKKLEKGRNSIECVSLLNEHRYQFGVYTVFDRIDGSGRHSEWSLKDTFTTKNAFLIENVNADRTAIEFEVKSVGVDETIETIDLIDTATNEVVKTIQGDKRKFEEILSNHEYNLVINYKYKVGNEDVVGKTEYKGIKTRKSIEPTGSLELSSNYEDVTYNASFVDEDKIIKSYKA